MDSPTDLIPLAEATVTLGMTRERALRRIQSGQLAGAYVAGRWFVRRDALPPAPKAA